MCLMDCLCAVAIYKENGDCWKKKLPLTNGKSDRFVERTAFIKVRNYSGLTKPGVGSNKSFKSLNKILLILLCISGFSIIILLGVILKGIRFIFDCKTLKQGIRDKIQETYIVPSFSYKELTDATDGFREELGRGAYGVVYKGVMGEISGSQTFIAVKKLDSLIQDAENIFKVEVNAIGQTHHKNLVRLIGYCVEGEHWLLVYEFMSNGTLSDFLCGTPRPSWEKRWPIAQGIAQGLLYLHEHCNTQIIHCDIKPQNILLDDDFSARISDFGMAKLLRLDQTQTNTAARGTRGYVAPEWLKNMPITTKVDVYSFGVLLLEIICCQMNVQTGNNEEGVVLLTDRALDCYEMKTINELVNHDTEALNDRERLEKMLKIVLWCIHDDPNLRPTMRMVLAMLEGLVQVPEPPDPASYYTSLNN